MPYIRSERRAIIVREDGCLDPSKIETEGELNFAITYLMNQYAKMDSYAVFNEVIGAIECAKLEFARRRINGYEDKKIKENGDVYGIHPRQVERSVKVERSSTAAVTAPEIRWTDYPDILTDARRV